jgi:hypothetical protein
MKKLLFPILLLTIFAACKKSSPNDNHQQSSATPSNKYVKYKSLDTVYHENAANGIDNILQLTALGDTAYYYAADQQTITPRPNVMSNYNGTLSMTDTLNFTSETVGIENNEGLILPFIYSMPNHTFSYVDPKVNLYYAVTIYQLNTTTVEVLGTMKSGSLKSESLGIYYKKTQ